MSKPNAILVEPLTLGQETIPRGTLCSGKTLLLFPLLIGFVFAVFFSSFPFTRSGIETPAINMLGGYSSLRSTSCPRLAPISVDAMQNTLKRYGIPSSPLAKFALTQYAATRDASMAAQVREEFSKLDHETQVKLKKLSGDVVVRAAKMVQKIEPEDLAGVTEPMGFWDPAGLATIGNFAAYRRAELKHGRVCMLASLGILVGENYHPFFDAWGDGPFVSAVQSHFTATAAQNFWPAFWLMAAGHELATSLPNYDGKDVGDYSFDPLLIRPKDPEELKVVQNKELNNGRLAMLGAAGMIAQELVTGKSIF